MLAQLKSVIRRPLSATLLILLLGAVSFGFVSRTVEYLAVSDAIEELSKYYKSIGYLTSDDGDVTEGARLLAKSDLVAINDARQYCIASLEGIYNSDLSGSSSEHFGCNFAEVLFWGELLDIKHCLPEEGTEDQQEFYSLRFLVKERLYGYPDYVPENSYVTITCYPEDEELMFADTAVALEINSVYGVRAYYPLGNNYHTGMILRQAVPGETWLLSEGDSDITKTLVEADAVQEINRHRVVLTSTKDMSAMPFTQETWKDAFLVDGRWLNEEDEKNANPVCVILQSFAENRNLNVGDTLTITMTDEDLATYYFFGYYPKEVTLQDIHCKEISTTTFTIVGICNRIEYTKYWTTANSTSLDIYVPDSCIPAELHTVVAAPFEERTIYEGKYSFVLKSAAAETEFLQRYQGKLEDMGYTVHMIENGWEAFYNAAFPIRQSAAYSFVVFFIAQMMTIIFAAFLYFRQHRREFAVARALGIPAGQGICWHLFPAAFLGIAGIGTGIGFGWNYAMGKVQETLKPIIGEGRDIVIELSGWIPVSLFMISLILLIMAVWLYFAILSHSPVLEILLESQKNQRRKKDGIPDDPVKTERETIAVKAAAFRQPVLNEVPDVSVSGNGQSGLRSFMVRHICRSRGSTVLILIVAVLFIVTLGWIGQSIRQTSRNIEELYENISIDAQILKRDSRSIVIEPGYLAGVTVQAIIDTGYIEESRLAAVAADAHLWDEEEKERFSKFILCGISGMGVLTVEDAPGVSYDFEKSEVVYAEGWDESLFSAEYPEDEKVYPIVVPESIMERFQVNPGEKLLIGTGSRRATALIAGTYTGKFSDLNELWGDMVVMPHSLMQRLYKGSLSYEIAEFTLNPKLNRELDVFREQAKEIMDKDYRSQCPVTLKIWDEELREVIEPMEKNLRLMQVLYPITQLVAMLAGGMVSLLLLLQNAKTAAILRVLGIPAKAVRRMLGAEQIVLGILGVAAGILLCMILGKWNAGILLSAALYLLGLLTGTWIGCAAVTGKKPLELLQVKE